METAGQNVGQEAADEPAYGQAHCLLAITALDPAIFPTERNGLSIGADEAAVGDRNTVGISAEIGKYGFRPTERRFGIDLPFGFAQRREICCEGIRLCKFGQVAEEGQVACAMQCQSIATIPRQSPRARYRPRSCRLVENCCLVLVVFQHSLKTAFKALGSCFERCIPRG